MRVIKRIKSFLSLVWRRHLISGRVSIALAWELAGNGRASEWE